MKNIYIDKIDTSISQPYWYSNLNITFSAVCRNYSLLPLVPVFHDLINHGMSYVEDKTSFVCSFSSVHPTTYLPNINTIHYYNSPYIYKFIFIKKLYLWKICRLLKIRNFMSIKILLITTLKWIYESCYTNINSNVTMFTAKLLVYHSYYHHSWEGSIYEYKKNNKKLTIVIYV